MSSHFEMGIDWYGRGDLQLAVAAFRSHLLKNPGDSAAWANLSFALGAQRKTKEQLEAAHRAVEVGSDNWFAWYALGLALSEAGEFEVAFAASEEVLRRRNDIGEVWDHRGLVLRELDRVEESIQCHTKATQISGRKVPLHFIHLGQAYLDTGDIDAAFAAFDKAREAKRQGRTVREFGYDSSQLASYGCGLARLLKGLQNSDVALLDQAVYFFREALRGDSDHVRSLVGAGQGLFVLALLKKERRFLEEALPFLERAVVLEDASPFVLSYYFECLERLNRDAEAELVARRLSELEPNKARWHECVAIVTFKSRQRPECLQAVERALALQRDPVVLNLKAGLLIADGAYVEAVEVLREACALQPDDPVPLLNLASCLEKVGALPEAEKHLNQVIAVDDGNFIAWLGKYSVAMARHDEETALHCLEKVRQSPNMDSAVLGFQVVPSDLRDPISVLKILGEMQTELAHQLVLTKRQLQDSVSGYASRRFEDAVERWMREQYGYTDTQVAYRPRFLRGKELDVYCRDYTRQQSRVTVCSCKLRLDPSKKVSRDEVFEFASVMALAKAYEQDKAATEGRSCRLHAWLVSNSNGVDAGARALAKENGIEVKKATLPHDWYLKGNWNIVGLDNMNVG